MLFKIGIFEVRYYGLVYVFTFLLVYYLFNKNRDEFNMDSKEVEEFVFYLMIGLLIGARLMHFLINQPSVFWTRPWELLMVWHGGMSFFGALLGIITAGYYFAKKHKFSFWKAADLAVLPATFGIGLGRIANLINQELVGTVSSVPWCFDFAGYLGCRHPYQLYGALSHFILFGLLVYLYKNKKKDGSVFTLFLMLYSVFRFITDFFRVDPRWFGLTSWQYMSVALFFVGLYLFYKSINSITKARV